MSLERQISHWADRIFDLTEHGAWWQRYIIKALGLVLLVALAIGITYGLLYGVMYVLFSLADWSMDNQCSQGVQRYC